MQPQILESKKKKSKYTCEVLGETALRANEEPLSAELIELRELQLPKVFTESSISSSCCDWLWYLAGSGKLDTTILCRGANKPYMGSHWKYLQLRKV